MAGTVRTVLREPMVHFLLLGAAFFALFTALDDTPPPDDAARIEVTETQTDLLAGQFEATWRRQPTDAELAALIDSYIEEEVLVREAQALGLDRGDAVVRQRLALKMRFLLESGADAIVPTDDDLQAHLAVREDRFRSPPLIAFEQVMLDAGTDPSKALEALRAGVEPDSISRASLLPPAVPASPERVVDATFGTGFFDAVAALAPDTWQGPVDSAYGLHLVRVIEALPGGLPELTEIRDAVEADWRAARREELIEERIAALMARYEISRTPASGTDQP